MPNLHVEMFYVTNEDDVLQALIVFAAESLELDFALLFLECHILLYVFPVLVGSSNLLRVGQRGADNIVTDA